VFYRYFRVTAPQVRCCTITKGIIVCVLEDEVTRWTDGGWHERWPAKRWDYRCGYQRPREIQVFGGSIRVRVARTRHGFRSKFVPAYQSRSDRFEQAVQELHLGGLAERQIRKLRRRTDPMNTFMGLDHLDRAIYLAIRKISSQRRNRVPLDLWSGGRKRRPSKRRRLVDLDAQRNEFFDQMMVDLGKTR